MEGERIEVGEVDQAPREAAVAQTQGANVEALLEKITAELSNAVDSEC